MFGAERERAGEEDSAWGVLVFVCGVLCVCI